MATDTTGEPMATPAPLPAEAVTAEQLARMFHETYERLAPSHGYETRKASAVPWDQVPEPNRSLMIAVAGEVLEAAAPHLASAERQRIIAATSSAAPEETRLGLFKLAAADGALRERERIAQAARLMSIRFWRPGNGPGAGEQALDVVPLGELLGALRQDGWHVSGEPEEAEAAVTYWRERWADTASRLSDAVGVIHDLARHASPLAHDADGFVAIGYTVTVGAIHRAYAWLQGASGFPVAERVETWQQYEKWLAAVWPRQEGGAT